MIEEIKSADGEIIYQHKSRPEMEPILDDNIADQMNRILRKAILEGTGKAMTGSYSIKNQICGKTGTAQDFSDAWFACYTPKLVMVTRVGASSPAIHFNSGSLGSGGRLALPLVGLTLNYAQKDAKLKREIFQSFDFEDSSVVNSLNCPDFKEKNSLEKIIDIFDINNGEKRNSKKRSLLDRLLGRKKEELQ